MFSATFECAFPKPGRGTCAGGWPGSSVGGMETPKPYNEIAVFVVLMVVGFALLALLTFRSYESIDKFCAENASQCVPADYPGKVVSK